jgi:HAD superfamily hydrolase (TIGR01450 family)
VSNPDIAKRLRPIEGIMFDLDGCLVLSDGPSGQDGYVLPGAVEAIEQARTSGRRLCVFTNGTAQSPPDIARHLRSMGLGVEDEEVLTPATVAAEVMVQRHPSEPILVFGGDGMHHDFRKRGVDVVDIDKAMADRKAEASAVVIGWDTDFGRAKLQLAAAAVRGGAKIYCTSDAPTFASSSWPNVGVSGFIAVGLSHVTRQPYEVLGKPSASAMDLIARTLRTSPERVLVMGDDIELEAAMALRAGALAGLVLTGTTRRQDLVDATERNRPDVVVESMTELVDLFAAAAELPSRSAVAAGRDLT